MIVLFVLRCCAVQCKASCRCCGRQYQSSLIGALNHLITSVPQSSLHVQQYLLMQQSLRPQANLSASARFATSSAPSGPVCFRSMLQIDACCLAQAPRADADHILAQRFPVPRIVICDQNGSQVRRLAPHYFAPCAFVLLPWQYAYCKMNFCLHVHSPY